MKNLLRRLKSAATRTAIDAAQLLVLLILAAFHAFGWKFWLGPTELTIARGQGALQAQTITGDGTRRRDVYDEILKKQPEMATLIQIEMKLRRVFPESRKVEWLEQDLDQRYVTVGAITPGAGTTGTIAMTDADIITIFAGQTLGLNPEVAVHVTAAVYTTGAATMTIDDVTHLALGQRLMLGAHIVNELSTEPTPLTRQPGLLSNNMFTARDCWGLSGWVMSDDYYGGVPRYTREREDAKLQHKISLDCEAWIGRQPAVAQTLNSQNIIYTDGIFAQQVSNVAPCPGGVLTWQALESVADAYERLLKSPTPYLFVSRFVRGLFNQVAYNKWVPSDKKQVEDDWGINVRSLSLGSKTYKVITVDEFQDANYGTTICAIDPNELALCSSKYKPSSLGMRWMVEYVRGMDITGTDGTTGCFLTDMAVRLRNEQGTWRMEGITTV